MTRTFIKSLLKLKQKDAKDEEDKLEKKKTATEIKNRKRVREIMEKVITRTLKDVQNDLLNVQSHIGTPPKLHEAYQGAFSALRAWDGAQLTWAGDYSIAAYIVVDDKHTKLVVVSGSKSVHEDDLKDMFKMNYFLGETIQDIIREKYMAYVK